MDTFTFLVVPNKTLEGDIVHHDGEIAEYAFKAESEREACDLVFPQFCKEHLHHSPIPREYRIQCISSYDKF